MAIAQKKECTVGSDDLKAAVKYCSQNSIPLMGTYGVMYDAYNKEIITETEGTLIISDMATRSKLPITDFQRVVDWFENRKGLRLF